MNLSWYARIKGCRLSRHPYKRGGKNYHPLLKQGEEVNRSLIDGGIVKSTTPHSYTHPQNGQAYTEFLSDKRDSVKRTIEILSKPTDKRRAVIARPHSVIVQNIANNRTYNSL